MALKDNQIVVGQDAYFQLKADPENVIISIKRLIGRGFGDSVVQQQLDRFAYKITKSTKGTENSLSVWLAGKEYEPEDISAEILKKVVQNAQTYQEQQGQREKITKAVITIPAYFNDKQRNATQICGETFRSHKSLIQSATFLPFHNPPSGAGPCIACNNCAI